MYAVPRPVPIRPAAKSDRRRRPLNAILPLCCLFYVAFLIAATVVLSLIPLYLPAKTATLSAPTFLLQIDFNDTLGDDGYFDLAARNAFAREIEKGLHLKQGAMHILTGTVATTASKRRRRDIILLRHRRGFRPDTDSQRNIQRIYLEYFFDAIICGRHCRFPPYIASLPTITIVVVFIFNNIRWILVLVIHWNPAIRHTVPPTYNPHRTTTTHITVTTATRTSPTTRTTTRTTPTTRTTTRTSPTTKTTTRTRTNTTTRTSTSTASSSTTRSTATTTSVLPTPNVAG